MLATVANDRQNYPHFLYVFPRRRATDLKYELKKYELIILNMGSKKYELRIRNMGQRSTSYGSETGAETHSRI